MPDYVVPRLKSSKPDAVPSSRTLLALLAMTRALLIEITAFVDASVPLPRSREAEVFDALIPILAGQKRAWNDLPAISRAPIDAARAAMLAATRGIEAPSAESVIDALASTRCGSTLVSTEARQEPEMCWLTQGPRPHHSLPDPVLPALPPSLAASWANNHPTYPSLCPSNLDIESDPFWNVNHVPPMGGRKLPRAFFGNRRGAYLFRAALKISPSRETHRGVRFKYLRQDLEQMEIHSCVKDVRPNLQTCVGSKAIQAIGQSGPSHG